MPQTAAEEEAFRNALIDSCFMIDHPISWDADSQLAYNERANIQMQMLSNIAFSVPKLKEVNDFGHSLVKKHPHRFGLLAALPTDNPTACVEEIERTSIFNPVPDGFFMSTVYNGVALGDDMLHPVWEKLDAREAVVFVHPNAAAPGRDGRPAPLIEILFDTTRTVVDMLYKGIFRRYRNIKFVLAHCGGALPAVSGRLILLGTESWVPNPNHITRQEMEEQLKGLYVDTAAMAKTGLPAATQMVGSDHIVYGSDCGAPCATMKTMDENKCDISDFEKRSNNRCILQNGWTLFPRAAQRVIESQKSSG